MTIPRCKFTETFEGSDQFYLTDPTKLTFKKNGGSRWGVKKEFKMSLGAAIQGHLNGTELKDCYGETGIRGVVLPPIRKSDSKCKWGAIDVDGNIYKDDYFKQELLEAIRRLDLPLIPCFSKSKGLHLYIFFEEWTDAQKVIDILHTFLPKLNLPPDTECFPKQSKLGAKDTGNGIMLPYMHGVGNDLIVSWDDKKFNTGSINEFVLYIENSKINAEDIKIELPEKPKSELPEKPKLNGKAKEDFDSKYTKIEILQKIKDGTIEQHQPIGGHYYAWIQVVICKCIKQGYGDNEILKLIKEVHKDKIGDVESEYTYPESYKKQINYTRGERQLNISNPGDTKILEGQSFQKAAKYEEIRKTYCYVMANDMFNKLGSADFYQATQINNFHAHEVFIQKGSLTQKLQKDTEFAKAETFITSAKYKPGLINITRRGIIPLINKGIVLNIYVPNYITEKKGDVQFLIDFFIWLIGEKKWVIIEQWIAYMLQYPGEKIKWSVVLVSTIEGAGKGLLARICSRILGYENVNENANYKHLTNTHNTLLVGTQLLVLNEVSLGDFKSKTEGTNTLKNFVADDYYSCNFKNKPMVKLPNLTNIMLFSNDERVVGVSQGVRRYFFCNITKTEEDIIKKTEEGFYKKAWDFVDSDEGAAALIYYFKKEVNIPKPEIFKARAPETEDLKQLIEQSKHPLQKKLEHDLTRPDQRKIFMGEFCGLATFDWLNDKLNTKNRDTWNDDFNWGSFGDDAIYKFLSANAIRWNNGEATRQIEIDGVRHRFYNLDDTRCPIPNKSYKDLTPKQIEVIYKNYSDVRSAIRTTEPNYKDAKENLPERIRHFKTRIERWIGKASENTQMAKNFYRKFKNKTVEQVYEDIMNGTIDIIEKDPLTDLTEIRSLQEIIKIGIKTPDQILEEYRDKDTRRKKRFSL